MSGSPAEAPREELGARTLDYDKLRNDVLRPPVDFRVVRSLSHWIIFLLLLVYFRVSVRGWWNHPAKGPVLVTVNHVSNLDPFVVAGLVRRYPRVMCKESLLHIPVLGYWCRAVGGFPVRRGMADRWAVRMAQEVLEAGVPFLIFPEGTRSRDGKPQEAQPGAAMIAVNAPADTWILPVRIEGTYAAMPPGARFPMPRKVRVFYGKPWKVADLGEAPQEKKALYRAVAGEMMKRIAAA
ncbi:MAG: lysophospholipid acyltransferase family protein [Candidatus Sumerlaeia bacterium]|nr:lysophospholipid acyltransferase family protein [Candidatus Sumerlaeia bacterium]